jgi:hypothetical protein
MFGLLIEGIRNELDEGPEGKKLLPWKRPDKETLKKNLKLIQGLDGYRRSTDRKVILRGPFKARDPNDPDSQEVKTGKPASS